MVRRYEDRIPVENRILHSIYRDSNHKFGKFVQITHFDNKTGFLLVNDTISIEKVVQDYIELFSKMGLRNG